jgi:hypothetical protein
MLTPILFAATVIVAGVEFFAGAKDDKIQTGRLVAGHFPLWCLFLGLAFVATGATFGVFFGRHAAFGRKTTGHVVEVQPKADDSDDGPESLVRYEVGGTSYEFRTRQPGFAKPGDRVSVTYLPDDPADGQVASQTELGLVFALGFVSLGMGTVVIWLVARP